LRRDLRLRVQTGDRKENVFVDEIGATLVTIAKGVKIQVEFDPAKAGA